MQLKFLDEMFDNPGMPSRMTTAVASACIAAISLSACQPAPPPDRKAIVVAEIRAEVGDIQEIITEFTAAQSGGLTADEIHSLLVRFESQIDAVLTKAEGSLTELADLRPQKAKRILEIRDIVHYVIGVDLSQLNVSQLLTQAQIDRIVGYINEAIA